MPVQIQRRLPECGRIRIGRKGPNGAPQKLDTFRLTSQDRSALDGAAAIYGGKVTPWPDKPGEFELITQRNEIAVCISPEPPSMWYEEWTAGGCKKRCDGSECTVPDGKGELKQVGCTCDPERRTCKLKTRVSFLLPDLPGLAIWRLDTGSYYAAMELPGLIDILFAAKLRNSYPEAVLALVKRKVVRENKQGKPETRIFPVVTLRINTGQPLRALLAGNPATGPQLSSDAPKAIEVAHSALPAAPSHVDAATGEVYPELDPATGRVVKQPEAAPNLAI